MDLDDCLAELRDISESIARIDRDASTAMMKFNICTKNMLLLEKMSYKSAKTTIVVIESLIDVVKLTDPVLSKIMYQYDCCQDTMKPKLDILQSNLKNNPEAELQVLLTDLVKRLEEFERIAVIPNIYLVQEPRSHSEWEAMIYDSILNSNLQLRLRKLDDMYPGLHFPSK